MTEAEARAEHDAVRFDKVLADVAGVSRSVARALIDAGEATINGSVAPARTRVSAGDQIGFTPPEAEGAMEADESVPFEVIAERSDYCVISKPAGVVVHPGTGIRHGTLVNGLLARYPEIRGVGQPGRWGIVHRLDRDTSGLMLIARTADGFEALSGLISSRAVERTYEALVVGSFEMTTGTIDAPIRRDPNAPLRMAVNRDGRPARTHYRRLEEWGPVSLMEVTLESGRTHQIRVHFSSIGHPVVGDPVYGRRDPIRVPRIFLHAKRLRLPETFDGGAVYEVGLPLDLAEVLANLRTS